MALDTGSSVRPPSVGKFGRSILASDAAKFSKQSQRAKRRRGIGTPLHCTPHVAVVRGMIDGSLTTTGLPPGQYGCVARIVSRLALWLRLRLIALLETKTRHTSPSLSVFAFIDKVSPTPSYHHRMPYLQLLPREAQEGDWAVHVLQQV